MTDVIVRGITFPTEQGWGGLNAYRSLGVKPAAFTGVPLESMGAMTAGTDTPLEGFSDKPWHPDSPLFWLGAVIALTFGLIGASTQIRVGPFKASAGAGNP